MGENSLSESEVINVEVAYATVEKQLVLPVQITRGTSIYDAAVQSNICQKFIGLDLEHSAMGVFGKLERFPKQRLAEAGDRIEIYRPLKVDPKEARKERARKSQTGRS
ncbi:MAG TPA: RnfH family protein [Pseudomonadales bacterium]|nr:RnfH family protein [Pseudomonadales bacterium]